MPSHQLMKQIILITVLLFILTFIISFVFYDSVTLLSTINSMFYVGMVMFLLSSFLFIMKFGFFDAITLSFRRFYKSFSRQGQMLSNDIDTMALPSEHGYNLAKPMFISSIIVLVTMLCFLFLYY